MISFNGEGKIDIGGKSRKVSVKNKSIALFTQANGDSLNQLFVMVDQIAKKDLPVNKLTDLLYPCLLYGAREEGQTVDFTREDVLDWVFEIKEEQLAAFINIITASLPKPEKENSKKK